MIKRDIDNTISDSGRSAGFKPADAESGEGVVFEAVHSLRPPSLSAARRGELGGDMYRFKYSRDRDGVPEEGAFVRFAWNADGLYVLAELEDSRLVALNREDEQLHYRYGDVFELFVKPRDEEYYWEMYAVPSGNKSTLFFPADRAGMELDDFLNGHGFRGLEISVEHTAVGWSVCMFVPASQLTALGADWGGHTAWTVFCGRYNYNDEELRNPELSMAPALSATNYHLTGEYAELRLRD